MPENETNTEAEEPLTLEKFRDQIAATPGDWHTAFLTLCDVLIAERAADGDAPAESEAGDSDEPEGDAGAGSGDETAS